MSFTHVTFAQLQETVAVIRSHTTQQPKVGLILGSGLGQVADMLTDAERLSYHKLPHWPVSTVHGHAGQLVFGTFAGQEIVVMQGRSHLYEGYSPAQLALPVRVMRLLGVELLIVTNAAGGLNQQFAVGDVMLLTDHINLPAMTGFNPLMGANLSEFGERFPALAGAYTPALRTLALQVAAQQGLSLQQGVYVALAGPSYETPAEVRFLQHIGGDAVGMSTATEVVTACHAGMQVLAFSGITNICDTSGTKAANHTEVMAAGEAIVPKLITLLRGVLLGLSDSRRLSI